MAQILFESETNFTKSEQFYETVQYAWGHIDIRAICRMAYKFGLQCTITIWGGWGRARDKRRRAVDQVDEMSIRWRTIYEATGYCADTDYSLWRFDVLARRALHARLPTNGLYGRKTFMPPPRFTAGLLLFSERSDGDVINLRSCVNFRLLSRQRNYRTFCLLLDKVFGFSGSWVTKSFHKLMKIFWRPDL